MSPDPPQYDYEVGVSAFTHVQVRAEDPAAAKEKAAARADVPAGWDVDELRPSRLAADGGRFDEPEAAWTDDYQWTRYRGPQPYPVPADWVVSVVEADGVIWHRYDGVGQDRSLRTDIDDDVVYEGTDDLANIGAEYPGVAGVLEDDPWHELRINGEVALVLQDGGGEEWWRAVAETLARFARGEQSDTVLADLGLERLRAEPFDDDRGTVPASDPSNRSLGDYGGDSA